MNGIIALVNDIVWGAPALVLILGVGLTLSWQLGLVQLRLFPEAWKHFLRQILPGKNNDRDSSFQALCAALAATVGTGNLVGVAGAICLGGPGAVFWMWVCGLLGMVTKYAEAVLAVRYRIRTKDGFAGGPMYMILQGLPRKLHPLAWVYAFFGLIASFGVGNATQIHAVMTGVHEIFSAIGLSPGSGFDWGLSALLAALIGLFLFGGAKRIYAAAEQLVPLAAAGYMLLCFGVLVLKWQSLPNAVLQIFQGAFCPRAVTGGMIGSGFQALRIGCSRGVFTNEAGMGTASIAHAGAAGVHPVRQGLMGIMEVFLDTIVICTLTALVILVSGVPIPYGMDAGGILTTRAFSVVYGPGAAVWLAAAMSLFAIATVIGWGLYGARCGQFLFGSRAWYPFAVFQILMVFFSGFLDTTTVWTLAEIFNGLMAIPNLITLAILSPEVVRLTNDYRKIGTFCAGGGNYANFHQCKPL